MQYSLTSSSKAQIVCVCIMFCQKHPDKWQNGDWMAQADNMPPWHCSSKAQTVCNVLVCVCIIFCHKHLDKQQNGDWLNQAENVPP
jgi:hypothetical protein